MSVIASKFTLLLTSVVVLAIAAWETEDNYEKYRENPSESVVIWWTPFTQTLGAYRKCEAGTCYFTENRDYLTHPNARAVLFYGSDFNVEDLPIPRPLKQWWGLLHEESPRNNPLFDHQQVLELFNLTGTFRRTSDFPLTLLSLTSLDALTSREEFVPTNQKTKLMAAENLAPVVYVHSDCDTPSERDAFVQELSRYIKVDSYGDCLHNRDLPEHIRDAAGTHNHPDFRAIMARYKFTLAIENAACEDYITEKLWRPLTLGSVPVYWGSPSIRDWLPNPDSAILISDFESPRDLAVYLHMLLKNGKLYDKHLAHKLDQTVTNDHLREALKRRKWGVDDLDQNSFIDEFECFICDQVSKHHEDLTQRPNRGEMQATLDHYGCPEPPQILRKTPNPRNFWVQQWHKAKAEADILNDFAQTNLNYTAQQFYERVIERLHESGHFHKFSPEKEEL